MQEEAQTSARWWQHPKRFRFLAIIHAPIVDCVCLSLNNLILFPLSTPLCEFSRRKKKGKERKSAINGFRFCIDQLLTWVNGLPHTTATSIHPFVQYANVALLEILPCQCPIVKRSGVAYSCSYVLLVQCIALVQFNWPVHKTMQKVLFLIFRLNCPCIHSWWSVLPLPIMYLKAHVTTKTWACVSIDHSFKFTITFCFFPLVCLVNFRRFFSLSFDCLPYKFPQCTVIANFFVCNLEEAQWPIGYGVRLRIKRSSVWIRPWSLRWVLGQGSLLPLSQGEAFTLASISYLAFLVKDILAKKKYFR